MNSGSHDALLARAGRWATVGSLLAFVMGCSSDDPAPEPTPAWSANEGALCRANAPAPGIFTDARTSLGIGFVHNAYPAPDPEDDGGNWTIEDLPGVAVADLDGDERLDLVFANGGGPMQLYLTGGADTLTGRELDIDEPTRVVTATDLDGDGDRDLAVVTRGEPIWLQNDGAGNFSAPLPLLAEDAPDVSVFSVAVGDVDGDGRPDLLLGGQQAFDEAAGTNEPGPEQLLLGSAQGFVDASSRIPSQAEEDLTFLAALADLDDDGDLDAYEINDAKDFDETTPGNRLLRNDDGTFRDVSAGSGADIVTSGMGGAVGDYDNDGLMDLYVTAMRPDRNLLLRNTGAMTFEDRTAAAGADTLADAHDVGWGAIFFDADADGWLDLFVTHGFIDASDINRRKNLLEQPNVLLRNRGDGTFEDVSSAAGVGGDARSRSPVVGDLNRDGFPDLLVGNVDEAPYVYLNGCDDRPWMSVRLNGPTLNRDAAGARIRVSANGQRWTRQILPGSQGLYGSSAPEVYFGFPSGTEQVTLEIRWPSGTLEQFEDVPVRRHITVHHPDHRG